MKKFMSAVLAGLIFMFPFLLTGCSTPKEEWTVPELTASNLEEISYQAPANWRSQEAESISGIYYYPYEKNSDGLLYISCQPLNNEISALIESNSSNSVLDEILLSIAENEKNIKYKSYLEISGFPAVMAKIESAINEEKYEYLAYVFFSDSNCYSILAGEPHSLRKEFEDFTKSLVDTIEVNSPQNNHIEVFIPGTTQLSEDFIKTITTIATASKMGELEAKYSLNEDGNGMLDIVLTEPDFSDPKLFLDGALLLLSTGPILTMGETENSIDGTYLRWGKSFIMAVGSPISMGFVHSFDEDSPEYYDLSLAYLDHTMSKSDILK